MTRKDYTAIAAALARTRPTEEDYTTHSYYGNNSMHDGISYGAASRQWMAVRSAIADTLAADNPRFDRVRFVIATEA